MMGVRRPLYITALITLLVFTATSFLWVRFYVCSGPEWTYPPVVAEMPEDRPYIRHMSIKFWTFANGSVKVQHELVYTSPYPIDTIVVPLCAYKKRALLIPFAPGIEESIPLVRQRVSVEITYENRTVIRRYGFLSEESFIFKPDIPTRDIRMLITYTVRDALVFRTSIIQIYNLVLRLPPVPVREAEIEILCEPLAGVNIDPYFKVFGGVALTLDGGKEKIWHEGLHITEGKLVRILFPKFSYIRTGSATIEVSTSRLPCLTLVQFSFYSIVNVCALLLILTVLWLIMHTISPSTTSRKRWRLSHYVPLYTKVQMYALYMAVMVPERLIPRIAYIWFFAHDVRIFPSDLPIGFCLLHFCSFWLVNIIFFYPFTIVLTCIMMPQNTPSIMSEKVSKWTRYTPFAIALASYFLMSYQLLMILLYIFSGFHSIPEYRFYVTPWYAALAVSLWILLQAVILNAVRVFSRVERTVRNLVKPSEGVSPDEALTEVKDVLKLPEIREIAPLVIKVMEEVGEIRPLGGRLYRGPESPVPISKTLDPGSILAILLAMGDTQTLEKIHGLLNRFTKMMSDLWQLCKMITVI